MKGMLGATGGGGGGWGWGGGEDARSNRVAPIDCHDTSGRGGLEWVRLHM